MVTEIWRGAHLQRGDSTTEGRLVYGEGLVYRGGDSSTDRKLVYRREDLSQEGGFLWRGLNYGWGGSSLEGETRDSSIEWGIIYGGIDIDSSTVYVGEDTWRGNLSPEGETYLTHLQRGTIYGGGLIYGERCLRGSTLYRGGDSSYERRGGDSSTEEETHLRKRTHLKRGRLICEGGDSSTEGGGDPFYGGGLIYRGEGDSSKEGDSPTEGETRRTEEETHILRERPGNGNPTTKN
jgi:hypothetical protein